MQFANLKSVFINWLFVHRKLNVSCSIKRSEDLKDLHLNVIIVIAYISLALGFLLFILGILVEMGVVTPATKNFRPIFGAFHAFILGVFIIQSLHLFVRITNNIGKNRN